MAVFFFMPTTLTATPVAPSLSSGLEFGRANWTAADHAAARASCRFVAGGRAYDLRALAGLTVVAELALGMESVGDKLQDELPTHEAFPSSPPFWRRCALPFTSCSGPSDATTAIAYSFRRCSTHVIRSEHGADRHAAGDDAHQSPASGGSCSARRRRARRPSRGRG